MAMLLRDYLNEFELDWAQAPVRSELIPKEKIKGARVLLIGGQPELLQAAAWSFLAWNDSAKAGIRVETAAAADGELRMEKVFSEEGFSPEEADYVILSGFCCEKIPKVLASIAYLQEFEKLLGAVTKLSCRRILLLSDGRVYGKLPHGFAASEYERG